jgi:hypothetical protein
MGKALLRLPAIKSMGQKPVITIWRGEKTVEKING